MKYLILVSWVLALGDPIYAQGEEAPQPSQATDASTLNVAEGAPKGDQLELMQIYEGLRQFDNGIAAAELVLKRDPNNKEALAGMTRLLIETGQTDEALVYSKRVLKVDRTVKSWALRASALLAAAKSEEAEALLRELKARHKGAGPFPYETMLGFANLDQSKKKEARAIFESVQNGSGYEALEVDTASKQLLLMDLDHALEWRDIEQARVSVARLRDDYAGEPETAAAEAVEEFLDGAVEEASAKLVALRSEFPRLRLYPFLLQMADFSYVAGDFKRAESGYGEMLGDRRTRPLDRLAAIRNRDQMRIREGEYVSLDTGITNGEEGSLATSMLKARKAFGKKWYFGGEFARQDISLDGSSAVRGNDDRMEGLLTAELRMRRGLYAEGKIGGADAGVIGAFTVGKRARVYSDAWSVGIGANERANDSAQLAALDGRQYRVSATVQREFNPRTVVSGKAMGRQVDIDGDKFGTGWGAEVDLSYRLNEEEKRSNFYAAWRSTYTNFDTSGGWGTGGSDVDSSAGELSSQEIAAQLIEPEYSRHGLELRHEGRWSETLVTRAMGGVYYRADSGDVEFNGGFGLDWYFKKATRLFVEALYTSSGTAGNAGSGAIEAKIGIANSF